MEEQISSSNINFAWLNEGVFVIIKSIITEIKNAREGCNDLVEYLEVPYNLKQIIIPEAQYKNLRFLVMDLDLLITNLSPILKDKTEIYKIKISKVNDLVDNRNLFIKDIKKDNQIVQINVLGFLNDTINYLNQIYLELIREPEVSKLLYIEEDDKRKW